MKYQKGFSLLATIIIVLVALIALGYGYISYQNQQARKDYQVARQKESDAALASVNDSPDLTLVKSKLKDLRVYAEVYYLNQKPNSYSGMCKVSNTDQSRLYDYVSPGVYPSGTNIVCNETTSKYAVEANLPNGGYWCIDSLLPTVVAKTESAPLGTQTQCQ